MLDALIAQDGALVADEPLLAQFGGALALQQFLFLRGLTLAHRGVLLDAPGLHLARELVLAQALLEVALPLFLDLLVVAL